MEKLSDNITEARIDAGMTQLELANEVGVSRTQITNIELGANPSLAVLVKISEATGVSIDWLVYGAEE